MIILAHDGSIYGDWVAKYALRFAQCEEDRKLLVLHVEDGETSPAVVANRLSVLEKECAERKITCVVKVLPEEEAVYRTLRHAIPHETGTLLVCGTRIKPRRNKFLSGSVAENLLRLNLCPVLALRVVQPGLIGSPRDILYPLSGHLDTDRRVNPVLERLAPSLRVLHLLRILIVNHLRHPYLSRKQEVLMLGVGRSQIDAVQGALPAGTWIDRRITISSNWSNEVLVQASRLKTEMILLGVGHPNLAQRIFEGSRLEKVLLETSCDVGIFHSP